MILAYGVNHLERNDGTKINPLTWWQGLCGSSVLSKVTTAILQCPTTSAATERSFSTYGSVHTKLRNKLVNNRASKLVYLKRNVECTSKCNQADKKCERYFDPIDYLNNAAGNSGSEHVDYEDVNNEEKSDTECIYLEIYGSDIDEETNFEGEVKEIRNRSASESE